jgi:sulfide:quinone oxidoreductase
VTPEPYVGHFGVGNPEAGGEKAAHAMEKAKIEVITNARVERVEEHALHLEGGRALPFAWAMLTPPFVGIDPVRACAPIVDERGMVKVGPGLRTAFEGVFAAGLCVSRPLVEGTTVPVGTPITGMLSEEMGRVAARNVVAAIEGGSVEEIDLDRVEYTVDAGIAGHWSKVAWERYFLSTRGRGIR